MRSTTWLLATTALSLSPLALAACGGDSGGGGGAGGGATSTSTGTGSTGTGSTSTSTSTGAGGGGMGDAQTPPQGETNVKAWLATGDYKKWHCEAKEHDAKMPSPHLVNRICSNDKLAGAGASGAFPAGSAAVKELWDAVGGKIIGYAVYLKTQADSAAGANWYWYEDNPTLNPPGGIVADGLGTSGNPKMICVGCHMGADSTFAATSRDFVFTQVP